MKKILQKAICAVSFLSLAASVRAEIYLTYSDDDIRSGFSNTIVTATISAAVGYTPDLYASRDCYSIQAIEFGIYDTSNLSSMKVWMRHHLNDADNLLEWDLDVSQLASDWNRIELSQPIDLSQQTDTLFFGYDYTQLVKSSKVVGVSGTKTACAIYGAANGKWRDYSTSYAPLAFRCQLRGNEPYDVAWIDLTAANRTQLLTEDSQIEPLRMHGILENRGYETLGDIQLTWVGEGQPQGLTLHPQLAPGSRLEFDFDYQPAAPTADNSELSITLSIPGHEDAKEADNTRSLFYEVIDPVRRGYPRQSLLLEQFTSLQNGFAPEGLAHCREAFTLLADIEQLRGVTPISIVQHQGYGPADAMRVSTGNPYKAQAIFGPEALQYAPALSIGHRAVLSTTVSPDSIARRVVQQYAEAPHVFTSIAATARMTDPASRQLNVSARFDAASVAWCDEPRVIVALLRKEVSTAGQADYGDFPHMEENVVVQYLTSAAGDKLTDKPNNTLSPSQLADMQMGRTPRYGLLPELTWTCQLPAGTSPSDYLVVLYVSENTDSSQQVDAAAVVEIGE